MKHSEKVKMARKMPRTAEDDENNEGKFTTAAWEKRKAGIASRIAKKQGAAHERAITRKEAAKGIKPSLTKRALAIARDALKRRDERKRRAAAHARKVARQQTKTTTV